MVLRRLALLFGVLKSAAERPHRPPPPNGQGTEPVIGSALSGLAQCLDDSRLVNGIRVPEGGVRAVAKCLGARIEFNAVHGVLVLEAVPALKTDGRRRSRLSVEEHELDGLLAVQSRIGDHDSAPGADEFEFVALWQVEPASNWASTPSGSPIAAQNRRSTPLGPLSRTAVLQACCGMPEETRGADRSSKRSSSAPPPKQREQRVSLGR